MDPDHINYKSIGVRRKPTMPLSLWLICSQLPYFILLNLILPVHGRGDQKRLVTDSLPFIIGCLPAVLAVIFSTFDLRSRQRDARKYQLLYLNVIALLIGAAILILAIFGWYRTLWSDPHGRWP